MKTSDLERILREHDYWASELYHKDALDVYQQYGASEALMIAEAGLTRFPHDIDLLVDALEWTPITVENDRNSEQFSSSRLLDKLKSLRELWTSRAYEAVIDYYMRIIPSLPLSYANDYIEAAIRESQSYIDAFPRDEQSRLTDAKVHYLQSILLNHPNAHSIYTRDLTQIIDESVDDLGPSKLTQSSLECVKALMDEGIFESAVYYAKLGLQGCVASDAADEIEELLQLMLLSNDGALMDRWSRAGRSLTSELKEDFERQIKLYSEFLAVMPKTSPKARVVELRCYLYKMYFNGAI